MVFLASKFNIVQKFERVMRGNSTYRLMRCTIFIFFNIIQKLSLIKIKSKIYNYNIIIYLILIIIKSYNMMTILYVLFYEILI